MKCSILLPCLLVATIANAQQRQEQVAPYGGMAALQHLFEQELHFPEEALAAKVKGETVIAVGVRADGTVTGMQVLRPLHPSCDAEALRLIALVRWKPSTAVEERGGAEHYLAVPFDPVKYKRWQKNRPERASPIFDLPARPGLEILTPRQLDSQVMPLVQGGMNGLGRHLASNMRYPEEAYRRSLEGDVKLEFTVEVSGAVSNMHALEEVGGGCVAEAMRLVHRTPWLPGTKDGERVRSTTQVTISFKLPQQAR